MKSFAAFLAPANGSTSIFGGFSLRRVATMFQVAQERHDLCNLDARALDDIGLTEAQASHESGRAFWDVPANR